MLFDGIDIRRLTPESLNGLVSVVQQNVFVFNASIRDNITMFRAFPQETLDEIIRRAHLEELVTRRGLDALCGEGGCELSGGEKQRIAIARALLKQSSILLADDCLSSAGRPDRPRDHAGHPVPHRHHPRGGDPPAGSLAAGML